MQETAVQAVQEAEQLQSAALLPAPVPRILTRRSVKYEEDLHKHLGLVLFGAYVLGSASSVAGMPGPVWLPTMTGAAIGGVFAAAHRYCSARVWRPPNAPLNILVTGGTKGLGKALAREFLTHKDSVVITGRSHAALAQTMAALQSGLQGLGYAHTPQLRGIVCDVTQPQQVVALAEQAREMMGSVDVWICNAGYSGSFKHFLDQEPETIEAVVKTNLLGTLLCSREAAKLMLGQQLGGHIFIMDGAGADGSATPQYAAYGATKASFPQLAASLRAELASTHVGVHVLSPGMMLTELLLEGATAANKQAFNILCEHPETVAAFLVPRVRSAVSCGLNGTYTRYLTPASAIYRLLTSPGRIGRFFDASGAPVYAPEHERILGKGAKATARQQALARARTSSLGVAYSLSLALSFVVLSLDSHASAFTGH
uniref:Chlorophyll b reductase n=1 Tax=Tetradesmus obliquus TaxID=3088 RepID=A0A383VKF8_TETOB|eukprot:jgi/Sobl393_1/17235/SZX65164.1